MEKFKMKKSKYIVCFLAMVSGCTTTKPPKVAFDFNEMSNEKEYKEVSQILMDSLLTEICTIENSEFIDLYPVPETVALDGFEKLILVEKLKTKGFTVTNWGRGNWQEGPRIVSYTMADSL